jgi:hypothetical protein
MPRFHWRQIEAIYNAALEHARSERAAYVAEACAADAELRREVTASGNWRGLPQHSVLSRQHLFVLALG